MRAYNSLKRNNITKIGQVLALSDDEFLRMRNFGQKSLDELKERLALRGFISPEAASATPTSRTCRPRPSSTRLPPPSWTARPSTVPHRVTGRRLGRTSSHRLHMLGNLAVAVLRYERVKTTEAKAKEVRGIVDGMITTAKRGDLTRAGARALEMPHEPLIIDKLMGELATKYADRVGLHPHHQDRAAARGCGADRPDRARLSASRETNNRNGPMAAEAQRCARAVIEYDGTAFAGSQYQPKLGRCRGSWRGRLTD